MQKLSITQAADKLGISKEAVYNRMRRGSLDFVEENGVKFVVFEDNEEITPLKTKKIENSAKTNEISQFIEYLIKEIEELKEKNKELELAKDELFKQKEQILIDTKNEIKELYEKRDEKLQYFINLISRPALNQTIEATPSDIEEMDDIKWISIGKFLDDVAPKKKMRKKIKKFLLKHANENKNLKFENGMLFVNKDFKISIEDI